MNSRLFVFILVELTFPLHALAFAGETLESVEKKITQRWSQLKSMSAHLDLNMSMDVFFVRTTGTVDYWNKQGREITRMEIVMTQSLEEGGKKKHTRLLSISDGEVVHSIKKDAEEMTASKEKVKTLEGTPGGRHLFEELKTNNQLVLLPEEKVDGQNAYVIEATPKKGASASPFAKKKLFFSKETGVLVKMIGLDSTHTPMMTLTYTNLKINPKVDPDRFVFKVPQGIVVEDKTGS